jgi:hypothetical protein
VLRGNTSQSFRENVLLSKTSRIPAYDEFVDVVDFPPVTRDSLEIDTDGVQLRKEVEEELEDFLSTIASMYIENQFHDFAHASHATMGVVKLLSSLAKSKPQQGETPEQTASLLIAASPLVQFAIVFSIICHDNDHPGVPNSILLKEKSRMASVYGYKSVAEQNSFGMKSRFPESEPLFIYYYLTFCQTSHFAQTWLGIYSWTMHMPISGQQFTKARKSKDFSARFL